MNAVMRVLLFDLNPEDTAQYIHTTLKYRNIASSIGPIMMIPAPEFIFADRSPSIKGRRCACVTVNCWDDTEMAYELVAELRRSGVSSIAHIGGVWTVKLLNDNPMDLLMGMAGDAQWILDDKIDDIADEVSVDNATEESDSEIAEIFDENIHGKYNSLKNQEDSWKTISSDGDIINMHNQEDNLIQAKDFDDTKNITNMFPTNWLYNNPSPIPIKPNLVRWANACCKDDCEFCVPIEEAPEDPCKQHFSMNFVQ